MEEKRYIETEIAIQKRSDVEMNVDNETWCRILIDLDIVGFIREGVIEVDGRSGTILYNDFGEFFGHVSMNYDIMKRKFLDYKKSIKEFIKN